MIKDFLEYGDYTRIEEKRDKLSKSTRSTYKTNITYFSDALVAAGYVNLPIVMLTKPIIKEALEKIPTIRTNITDKGVNEYLENITGLLHGLVEWDVLDANPAIGIRKLDEVPTEACTPATDQQFEWIKTESLKGPSCFRLYCMLVYQTGIRPMELNEIKVSSIDFENLFIKLKPEGTKTNKFRTVPITVTTAKVLKDYLQGIPNDWHPFGRNMQPSEKSCHRNRYSEAWKKWIKDVLKIEVDMYSLKHRGADDRKDSNISDDAIAHLFGHHSNVLVRQVYNKKKSAYDSILRDSTPEF